VTAILDFARESARRYLQSVVFVDDEIYLSPSEKVAAVQAIPSTMNVFRASPSPAITKPSEAEPAVAAEAEKPPFHPKHLVESFAKERMVCALYEPAKGFTTGTDSEIFRLCERADIVILDWDLYNEDGRNILPLISGLVSQSQTTVPHHVRLCAIYTTKPDLIRVTNQVFEHLKSNNLSVEVKGDTALVAGASKIIALGKPTVGRGADQKKAEVAEADLAQRIIDEFAAMHEGILPSMALHGMAAIRASSKKILDKFHQELDGAFLVHRGLLLPADDAFEQVPELLAEEALAVMIDHRLDPEKTKTLAEDAIQSTDMKIAWETKEGKLEANAGQIARTILKEGPAAVKKDFDLEKKSGWMIDALHTAMDGDKNSARKRLAALYNTRTQYSDEKHLSFGTIVRKQTTDGPSYSVCLMPLCDSVRLSNKDGKAYDFPFWKLRTSNSGASARGVVVELPEGGFVELFLMGKPRDQLWMEKFKAGTKGTVIAVSNEQKNILAGPAIELEWIAQLKPAHAQRIAQDIGNSFSRVGLIEAEWLRIKSERSK
jgi:hypothetical protein